MNDPDYGTISDIDPDGGGDYTTLQAWYEDTYDEAEIQHARCHHSDSTDLGELDTSTQNWAYAPTADEPVCIYAADGDEADGSKDDDLQGAAILAEAASAACLAVEWEAVRTDGLRLTPSGQFGVGVKFDGCESVLIERCTVVIDDTAGIGIAVMQEAAGETTAAVVRNNLVLNTNSSEPSGGIIALANSGSSTVNATLHGNSIANCASAVQGGIAGYPVGVGDTANVAARNNVVVDDGVYPGDCFDEHGAGAVSWTGSSHNVSSDATAKGSDALINKAIADVWADIADNDAPFAPKAGGELDPPDGVNLYAAGAVEDAIGQPRSAMPDRSHYRGGITLWKQCPEAFKRQVTERGVA